MIEDFRLEEFEKEEEEMNVEHRTSNVQHRTPKRRI